MPQPPNDQGEAARLRSLFDVLNLPNVPVFDSWNITLLFVAPRDKGVALNDVEE